MKKATLLATLALAVFSAFGQTPDTTYTTIGQTSEAFEKTRFIDRYEQIFRTQQPTRWLFKINPLEIDETAAANLSVEYKLSPSFSLNASYAITGGYQPDNNFTAGGTITTQRYGIETRWYYAMKERIAKGLNANNMSGNYIALEASRRKTHLKEGPINLHFSNGEQTALALRFGLQRRLFRYGFMDLSYGLGASKNTSAILKNENSWQFFANSRIALGFALATPNRKLASKSDFCDVLRCFSEERRMWKIDLYNLFRFERPNDQLKVQLTTALEQKLGDSPFSVQIEGGLGYQQARGYSLQNQDVSSESWQGNGNLQARYYFNQQRRIARGKSGNNLNGLYLGVRSGIEYRQGSAQGWLNGIAGPVYLNNDVRSITSNHALISGFQYRLFEHGFVDWQLGCGYGQTRSDVTPDNQPAFKENRQGLDLSIQFRLGLAF